jgi:Xaa-Pro aminopeptidase
MLYVGMSAVKDGATDYDILGRWPDSPRYWGFDTWNEVIAYAFGHGLGLTLHDRPVISMTKKAGGYAPTLLKEGMILALETWTGRRGGRDGVRLEENVLVTKEGYELLTRWPIAELIECWLPY